MHVLAKQLKSSSVAPTISAKQRRREPEHHRAIPKVIWKRSPISMPMPEAIHARRGKREPSAIGRDIPTAYDGLKGVALVDAVVDSATATYPAWITPVAL